MSINNLTLGEIKDLVSLFNSPKSSGEHPYQIGKAYFIRTVTMSLVGKLKAVYDSELVLEDASWVADSGRFHDALKNGLESSSSSEIEPFLEDVIIGRGSIIDTTVFCHNLPKDQK